MSENAQDLKEVAQRVKALGAELTGAHSPEELREVWRRLPNVVANPPKGQKALAERVALYLIDLGDEAPKDLKEFLTGTEPLRAFGPLQEAGAVSEEQEGGGNEPAAVAGDSSTSTDEATDMQTQTNTGRKKRATPQAAKGKKTSTTKTKRVAKDDAPRPNTIQALIVDLSKEGKTTEQIVKAVAKAFPKSAFAKNDEAGQKGHVGWYRNNARKRGWLPKIN